jgi:hypothetical protein
MAIWCDRKSCAFRKINKGEIINLPEAIGKGYCVAFSEEIHISYKGRCTTYHNKRFKHIGNSDRKEDYDRAYKELTNPFGEEDEDIKEV